MQERIKQAGEITDGRLVQRTIAGDEHAYAMLVQRYSSPLFHFICRFLNDYDTAGDILQQVFLQLYLSLSTLNTDTPLKPWLFQVARNRCLDELRCTRHKQVIQFSALQENREDDDLSLLETIPDPALLPEEVAERHDLQKILQQAIDTLSPKYRSIVLLRYAGQLTFVEIGQALHMPATTVKTYFQRSKPLLRAALAEKIKPLTPGPSLLPMKRRIMQEVG